MKITYDYEADALYIRFTDTTVTTKHLEDGIAIDYDAAQRVHNPETLRQVLFKKGARPRDQEPDRNQLVIPPVPESHAPGSGNKDSKNWASTPPNP